MIRFLCDESGQGLAEYGLILVLVSVVAVVICESIGLSVIGNIESVTTSLTSISS